MESNKPILSIIIVSFNAKYFLYLTLKSLEKISQKLPIEVIIVDNNSTDKFADISFHFPNIKWIQNPKNFGFGAANNIGVNSAKSENILILNPDTIISEKLIKKGLETLSNIENVGAVGVKMLDGKGNYLPESKRGFPNIKASIFKLLGIHRFFPVHSSINQYYLSNKNHDEDQNIEVISGACFFIKKKVYEAVGGFDEKYFMYGEDIDISMELSQHGYQNYYIGTEEMIHFKGESSKKSQWNYHHHFYDAMYIFWNKNLNKTNQILMKGFVFLACQILKVGSFLKQKMKDFFLPTMDSLAIYTALFAFTKFWSTNLKGEANYYPSFFYYVILPAYVLIWIFCLFFNEVYSYYSKISNYFKGSIFGAISILVIFSFLPENYRYSRAIVLFGSIVAISAPMMIRFFYAKLTSKKFWIIDFNSPYINFLPNDLSSTGKYNEMMNQYLGLSFDFKNDSNLSQLFLDFEKIENEVTIKTIAKNQNKEIWFYLHSIATIISISHKNERSLIYSKNDGHNYFHVNNQLKQFIFNRITALGVLLLAPILYWMISKKVVKNSFSVLIGKKRWFFIEQSHFEKNFDAVFWLDSNPIFNSLNIEKYFRQYKIEEDFKLFLWTCAN